MHRFLKFILGMKLYIFRTVPLSIISFSLWKTPDDGQRNCPKHVDFHSKNKFEKSVHLVGFIIRNYFVFQHNQMERMNGGFVCIQRTLCWDLRSSWLSVKITVFWDVTLSRCICPSSKVSHRLTGPDEIRPHAYRAPHSWEIHTLQFLKLSK